MTDRQSTHPLLTVATLAVLLAGCDGGGRPAAAPAPEAERPPTSVEATTADTSPTAAAGAYEFYLLTRKGEPVDDPRIVSTMEEHPCGPVDLVRVSSIPMNDPVFVPQYVVEFEPGGKEIAKWGIPNEADVVALDGQRLQFQVDADRFSVATDGSLQKLADSGPAKDFRTKEAMFECPALPTFPESGAAQCFRVQDAAGKQRLVALEGVCS